MFPAFRESVRWLAILIVAIGLATFGAPYLRDVPISPISARGIGGVPLQLRLKGVLPPGTTLRYVLIRRVELPSYLASLTAPDVQWKSFPANATEIRDRAVFGFSSISTFFGNKQTRHFYDDTVLVEYCDADDNRSYSAMPIPTNSGSGTFIVVVPAVPPIDSLGSFAQDAPSP